MDGRAGRGDDDKLCMEAKREQAKYYLGSLIQGEGEERERRGGYRFLFNRMKCNQSAGYFDHLPEMPGWKTFWAESLSVKHGIV